LKPKNLIRNKGEGLVFIISAPSGTGKTTLLKRVMEELPGLKFSVSYTTRAPRANEKEGEDYHFVCPPRFQEMMERGEFFEWAEVVGNRYGTASTALTPEGFDVILDIDTQGAKKVKEKIGDPVLIFILPPSYRVLKERLIQRGLDSIETIEFRLAHALREIEEAHGYPYVIINDRIEEAVGKLKAIIIAERCRKGSRSIVAKIKSEWEDEDGENHG
jgi:guanylate kinase